MLLLVIAEILKKLKLENTHAVSLDIKVFWEILSSMKLTYLSVEHCVNTLTVGLAN